MNTVSLSVVLELCMAFGMVGLLWPEKLMPLFLVLMFPWSATYRAIRANSIAAIGLSLLLLAVLVTSTH
jgi:hypothetical protein